MKIDQFIKTFSLITVYPKFYSLQDKDREIVNKISEQIPLSCETVAGIYLNCQCSIRKTTEYIFWVYGYVVGKMED